MKFFYRASGRSRVFFWKFWKKISCKWCGNRWWKLIRWRWNWIKRMKIEYSSRINLLNTGGSCSCIKIQIKKKKKITKSEICQELQYLKLSLIYLRDYGYFEELSNKIMKKLKKFWWGGCILCLFPLYI